MVFKKGNKPWNKEKTKKQLEQHYKNGWGGVKKGNIPWNKGLKGEEYKKHYKPGDIGKTNRGKHLSKETKQKMSISRTGKKRTDETKRKIAEAKIGSKNPFYGKHHTEEHKKRLSELYSGENSFSWRGGISFEPYPKEFNRQIKKYIFNRDEGICQACNKIIDNGYATHHIDYNKENNNPYNLILLCNTCHGKTGADREYWQNLFLEKLKH